MTLDTIRTINTQADAVLHFFEQMDTEMLNDILHDDRTYQDFPKDVFIQKLDGAFEVFKNAGDSLLSRYYGKCSEFGCNAGCQGFTFIGNKSTKFLNIILDIENGKVIDIYECKRFDSTRKHADADSQVYIDVWNAPF